MPPRVPNPNELAQFRLISTEEMKVLDLSRPYEAATSYLHSACQFDLRQTVGFGGWTSGYASEWLPAQGHPFENEDGTIVRWKLVQEDSNHRTQEGFPSNIPVDVEMQLADPNTGTTEEFTVATIREDRTIVFELRENGKTKRLVIKNPYDPRFIDIKDTVELITGEAST